MMRRELTAIDCWRAVVLYGRNSATYELALATCLLDFADQGQTQVPMPVLAERFFHVYRDRLASGKRQGTSGTTVLERIVARHRSGELSESNAIEQVERQGFDDVTPRFHTVTNAPVPLPFYEVTGSGLVLTDSLFAVLSDEQNSLFRAETSSRWDLLEVAFEMHLPVEVLGTDEHRLYRERGYDRVIITGTRPVLNGYQNGLCFYCAEPLVDGDIHVDHVIPRVYLHHDEIWNLVLTDWQCNLSKSARLPTMDDLKRLFARNEYFIASNHPIRRHLLQQTGETLQKRRDFYVTTYDAARKVVVHTWQGRPTRITTSNPLAALVLTPQQHAEIR